MLSLKSFLKSHSVFYVYKVKLNCGLNTIPPTNFCSYVVFHVRLTSTTVASPGCSTKRDGLTAKGGCSEKYVLATDYIKTKKSGGPVKHMKDNYMSYLSYESHILFVFFSPWGSRLATDSWGWCRRSQRWDQHSGTGTQQTLLLRSDNSHSPELLVLCNNQRGTYQQWALQQHKFFRCQWHSHVSTGGGRVAAMGTTSMCSVWVSTTRKSSKSPRESGAKWTMYLQLIPGATTPPSPGNLPDKTCKINPFIPDALHSFVCHLSSSRWCWCSHTGWQQYNKEPRNYQLHSRDVWLYVGIPFGYSHWLLTHSISSLSTGGGCAGQSEQRE